MTLAHFIYNRLIGAYTSLIGLAAPFHPKARQLTKGHQELLTIISAELATEKAERVWFHCASLGEFEQGRPLMEAFRERYPAIKIVLTFFSPSGYEVRKNYPGADYIYYLPFDTPSNATSFLKAVKPRLAFFVKYEFWYNYLYKLHQQQVPALLISGIFRPGQLFFKSGGGFYRNMLHFFDHLFVQNEESLQLLGQINITSTNTKVSLSGDTRFDRVAAVCKEPRHIPLAEAFKGEQALLVAGSSWAPDLQVLAPLLRAYKGRLKCIIAPHEVDEQHLREAEKILAGLQSIRFSKANLRNVTAAEVLLIDNVGMLSALYALADFAWVGGSFGKGLHNILEAATFGMPVFFGNRKYHNFREATELISRGGAFAIADTGELQQRFNALYNDEAKRRQAARQSAEYVKANTGATLQIMKYVNKLMDDSNARKNI